MCLSCPSGEGRGHEEKRSAGGGFSVEMRGARGVLIPDRPMLTCVRSAGVGRVFLGAEEAFRMVCLRLSEWPRGAFLNRLTAAF